MKKQILKRASLLLCIFLASCSEPAEVQDLSAEVSLELLTSLMEEGIQAERIKESGESYKIILPKERYSVAVKKLSEISSSKGAADEMLERALAERSLIPESKTVRETKSAALKGLQIERAISLLPGVKGVRVFPGGAVLTHDGTADESEVQMILGDGKLISRVIENKSVETIAEAAEGSVNLKRLAPFSFRVPEEQKKDATWELMGLLFVASVLSLVIGLLTGIILERVRS